MYVTGGVKMRPRSITEAEARIAQLELDLARATSLSNAWKAEAYRESDDITQELRTELVEARRSCDIYNAAHQAAERRIRELETEVNMLKSLNALDRARLEAAVLRSEDTERRYDAWKP